MLDKYEKIAEIYRTIAEKDESGEDLPVMLGDCLDWKDQPNNGINMREAIGLDLTIMVIWKLKRKAIQYQPDECIDAIYNMIIFSRTGQVADMLKKQGDQ